MRETIHNYFEKTKQYLNYYTNEDFSTVCEDIKKELMIILICFGILVLEDIVSCLACRK